MFPNLYLSVLLARLSWHAIYGEVQDLMRLLHLGSLLNFFCQVSIFLCLEAGELNSPGSPSSEINYHNIVGKEKILGWCVVRGYPWCITTVHLEM